MKKLKQFSDKLSWKMVEQKIILEADREIHAYGIENGIIIGINFLTALLLGLITGRPDTVLVFLFSFLLLRSFTGGIHLDNRVLCYLASSFILFIPAYGTSIFVNSIPEYGKITALVTAIIVILRYAPMDSKKRKLDEEERKHFRKISFFILGIELCIMLMFYCLKVNDYACAVYFAIVLTAILMVGGMLQLTKTNRSEA